MGTTEEKLDYLEQTKKLIAAAIEEQGVNVSDEDTFRAYAALIATIGKLPDLTKEDEGKILQVIGGAWGIGAGLSTDATLKTAGAAADAKVTGERFGTIEGMIGEGFEVSSEVNHDMNLDIEADAPTKATHSWFLVKDEGVIALRLKKLAVRTVGEGTVRFALYNRTKKDDDTIVLTLEKILGEVAADTETGTASLTIDGGYYTEAVSPVVVFSSDAPIIGDYTVGSLVMKEAIILTDIDFMNVTEGEQVTCPLGDWVGPELLLYSLVCDSVKFRTVNEFANSVENRLSAEKHLPAVTESDNGKVLSVVGGAWAAAEAASSEIPSYDLTAMGLPTVTVDGGYVDLTTDTTQLMNDFANGSVKLSLTMAIGSYAMPVSIICNTLVIDGASELYFTFVSHIAGMVVHSSIDILDGRIRAISETLESIVTPYIDAYMEDALGGDY